MSINVAIIGAGGHAKEVVEILREDAQYSLQYCITKSDLKKFYDIPVLNGDDYIEKLPSLNVTHAFVAIGDNVLRKKLYLKLKSLNIKFINAISKNSVISKSVKLGENIVIMPGAIVNADAIIQDNVILNTGCTVSHDCVVEAHAHIAPGVNIAGNVYISEGAFLGVGARVIPKCMIGKWSIVGAGGVVIENIPENSLVVGVPAKIKKPIQLESLV